VCKTTVRFISFPLTEPPPPFCADVAAAFSAHEAKIGTRVLSKGLTSNEVLSVIRDDLLRLIQRRVRPIATRDSACSCTEGCTSLLGQATSLRS
jgi:hypothetical protein